ncbi:MAG: long-chain fatty acid--CoA ligase [Polyangiaceae bacterium]|nr:long-chain fatty acid--CoA ligase [Polyangiaceae bacterium]MCE7894075.1 long-chain fatty acid--CoA ligase [Sorangiineae bacterium PRO1]MCL4748779.1 long-chain fatty acid--CoA ligase [Myxococcales bacterium]
MAEQFKNLVDLCEKSCKKYKDRELFGTKTEGSWKWMTYGEFEKLVDDFRGGLASLGVGAGDKVGIVANNRIEWAVAAYATYGLGAAFVPMYEAQKADEWRFILDDCGAKIAIGATPDIYKKLKGVKEQVSTLQHVIGFEEPESDDHSYAALLKKGADKPVPAKHPAEADTAGFIYTSGTTGNPKGVILSHSNICSNINAIHAIFPFDPNDRSLSFLPWAHSFGQTCELHAMLSMGCSMGINDAVENLVANLAEVQPTILFAVPRIFNRIYDGVNKQMTEKPGFIQSLFRNAVANRTKKHRGEDVGVWAGMGISLADSIIFSKIRQKFGGRLKYAVSGSAALSKEVAEFIDALGIEVYEGYGLTETSPIATANFPGHRKIGSVGKPIPGVTISIDKAVTGDPKHGEILIKGPNIMQGYHNRDDENKAVLMEDRTFRSGDMGFVDEDGYLYITGRIKEQYKLENGKYVVPSPLEEELKLSPFIANVMIHGANKPYNVALVVPDKAALDKWAADNGKTLGDVEKSDEVKQIIEEELKKYAKSFKGFERPEKFVLTSEDFTTDNGMLTPTLKLKRRNVLQKYEPALDALYN